MTTVSRKPITATGHHDNPSWRLCTARTGSVIEQAATALSAGRLVVLVDDQQPQGDADLMFVADRATTELMTFMVRYTSGFVCVAVDPDACDRMNLPPMQYGNHDSYGSAYTVTVDAAHGVTTGISAQDRAHTARMLADPNASWDDLSRPGHVQPLRSRRGGVLATAGRAEAAVDLARIAGSSPAAVLCQIVSPEDPRKMACGDEAQRFSTAHDLVTITITDIADFLATGII